jgi:hypothetical protein
MEDAEENSLARLPLMKLLEVPVTVQERVQFLLQPIMADRLSAGNERLSDKHREAWRAVIDERLKAWQQSPEELDEDGLEPPSAEIFPLVEEVALVLKEQGVDPPLRIVPNGEGGVMFEWRHPPFFWSLDVEKDGSMALSVFRNSRLVSRHQLS